MKLFGDPIELHQIEIGKFYKIVYTLNRPNKKETIYAYHKVESVDESTIESINKSRIEYICPINIEFDKNYLFYLDDQMSIIGHISEPSETGITTLWAKKYLTRIHVSQITGVLPANKKSIILYPLGLSGNNVSAAYTALVGDSLEDYLSEGGTTIKNKNKKNKTKKCVHNKQ